MLTADAMPIVFYGTSLFVWCGKHVPRALRGEALTLAEDVVTQNGLPTTTRIAVVKQGLESPDFKALFGDWRAVEAAALAEAKALKAAGTATEGPDASGRAVDVAAMAAAAAAPEPPVDDGSGSKQVRPPATAPRLRVRAVPAC